MWAQQKDNYQPVVIISAELATLSARENMERTSEMYDLLKQGGFTFAEALGMYKGAKESSFIVHTEEYGKMLELALDFEQEAVLIVDRDREAFLKAPNDSMIKPVGRLTAVQERDIIKLDNWTKNLANDTYYAVRGSCPSLRSLRTIVRRDEV